MRALATRLLEQAKLAEDNTARLNGVSDNSNAEADRGRARRIADEATGLRGDAESRAVEEIEQALAAAGVST
ncbi:hypothetical protein HCN51_54865 [Nonomuraea sp. FMUSA5-5]|uniref:Uncharacterized protein n=1 Tax=Nonomuraea composti TaxID=2720023 RepID=A0ABX1BKY7_9ACTN|nr:hypothetical protein [Nonomuraea sp. FMUSA5-5]NJP98415.1 hypothetical protein [Nonomuraea sp. FMUSA5-5]